MLGDKKTNVSSATYQCVALGTIEITMELTIKNVTGGYHLNSI